MDGGFDGPEWEGLTGYDDTGGAPEDAGGEGRDASSEGRGLSAVPHPAVVRPDA